MDTPQSRWRRLYLVALTDTSEIAQVSLLGAEDAVFERLYELEGVQGAEEERLALENTLQELRLLRSKGSHFRV